jgi:lysine-N-methylase
LCYNKVRNLATRGNAMKLYAPAYYKKFKCIADKCEHSCCIGWEIDIDADTLAKYKSLKSGYGATICDTIDWAETPHFRLVEGERCPHLDECGLCKMILNVGEEYLSDICREHPRFYNRLPDRLEVGLGASCEEAARLILSASDYASAVALEGADEPDPDPDTDDVGCQFIDPLAVREKIYSILSSASLSYSERLERIRREYCPEAIELTGEEAGELISSLEYIDPDSHAAFLSYSPFATPPSETYAERALAYFIYRHVSPSETEGELSASLALALFLERLFSSLASSLSPSDLDAHVLLLRRISEEIEYSTDNTDAIKEFLFPLSEF